MKKILTILFLFFGLCGYAQYSNKPTTGSPTTLNEAIGSYGGRIGYVFTASYADTTAANVSFIKNVAGQLIRIGDTLWLRSNDLSHWIKVGGTSASGTITGAGNLSPLFTTGVSGSNITFALSNAGQYTLFGRGTSTGSPSFLTSIDSNWIPTLHSENYYNTKYAPIGSGTNIYNSNGTLTGDRVLTGGANDLTFTGVDAFTLNSSSVLITGGLTNLSTQNRIIGQFGTSGQIGYINTGLGLTLASGVLNLDTSSFIFRDTLYVQSPLFRLNDSTIAITIVSTSDTGVATPAMKILWDAKIGGTTDNNIVVSSTNLNSNKTPLTLGATGAVTWNRALGYVAKITATGDVTLSITNLQQGDFGYLVFYQDGTGGHTLTLPGAGLVVTNTAANDSTIYTFAYYGTDRFDWRNNLGVAGLTGVQGDMIYFTGTNTIGNLNKSAGGFKVISNQGSSNNPSYSTIDFSNILGLVNPLTQINISGTPGAGVYLDGLGAWSTPIATVPLTQNQIAYGSGSNLITSSANLKFTPGAGATLEFTSTNVISDFYLRGSGDDCLIEANDGSLLFYSGSGPTLGAQLDFNRKFLVNKSSASGSSPFQVGGNARIEGDIFAVKTGSGNTDLNLQNSTGTTVLSAEGSELIIWILGAARHFGWTSTAYFPYTNAGATLGTTSKGWGGLRMSTGTTINWNNGELLLTEAADLLTLSGGNWAQAGSSSGVITFATQAAAGTFSFNWPTTAGTTGYFLTSGGGGSTAMTWTSPLSIALYKNIDWDATDAPNSGTSETDIYTKTVAANTLVNDGEDIIFETTINLTDITSTAQIRYYFAGTLIGNTGALTVSATGSCVGTVTVMRTSSTTARATVSITTPTGSTAAYTAQTDLTGLDFTTTNIIKVTGTAGGAGGGSSDIVGKLYKLSWRNSIAH